MPKVTSVEPQKNNPRRFNIFLDGEFAFGVDEDLVVNRRLVVGKEINPEDLDKILFEAEVGKLMERMYRLFNIRQRSEKEVRNYLKNLSFKRKLKGEEEVSELVISELVENLKKKGIVNDEEFAKAWVEARSKKKGLRVIKLELLQKGISREIIEEVISGQVTGYSEEEVAEKLLGRKIEAWINLPTMEFKKKAYQFLLRRGFEYDIVKDIVEKYLKKG